jgi:ribonuclease HI
MTCSLNVYTDGGSRGNPGPGAIGVVIQSQAGKTIHSFSRAIGHTTNNVAEYTAVIEALKWLIANKDKIVNYKLSIINFYSDSQLMVNQLNGNWKIKDPELRQKNIQVRSLEQLFKRPIRYQAIPRTKNKTADSLVKKAYFFSAISLLA